MSALAEMDAHLEGPWFVGCVENECRWEVFGPLWSYADAQREAGPAPSCGNTHLIGRTVSDRTRVLFPVLYMAEPGEAQAAAVRWHRERLRSLGRDAADVDRLEYVESGLVRL